MIKKSFHFIIAAILIAILLSCSKQEAKQPNIVFVFADQLRSMELGCYGGTQVATPNFDRLASEGVRFTNAISTSPICSPFRAMLLTGNYPVKNGMVTNDHFMHNPTPYFAEACKAEGYNTGYIGKWHIDGHDRTGRIPKERWHGFDYWRTLECTHDYNNSKYFYQEEEDPRVWEEYDAVSQTKDACNYIKEYSSDQPFCLFLSWGPPHNPYYAPEKYMKQINPDEIVFRKNVDDFATAEKLYKECDTYLTDGYQRVRKMRLPVMLDKENKQLRKWYHGYLASIATIDDLFGEILKTLEEKGELDNTIIVFTSDHGDHLGSHRQHEKDLPFEESISIPFIIRYPEKIKAGIKTDALFAPIDIMPTVLSLANVTCPDIDGFNMSRVASGEEQDLRDAVLLMKSVWVGSIYSTSGVGPWRGVRTKRYTYARNSHTRKPWMLYDNVNDPYQYKNLVDDSDYSELVEKLDAKTTELLAEAGDPEDPQFFIKRVQEERVKNGFSKEKDGLIPTFVEPGSSFDEFLK